MERRQMHKLSTLSDVEIEKCLNSMDFDFDTDGEEESEDDLADEVCETAFPVNDEDQEAIERAVNMSDSMLASEICVTSSGSSAPLAKLLSPSTSIASNSPQAQKRKRKAPAEHDIAHAEESTITEFVGSVLDIDPKSPIFKKILWRQNNLVLDKSAISFTEIDLGDLKKLDTPFKCFEYFLNDTIIEHITQQTNLYAAQKDVNTSFSTTDLEIRQFIGILFFMSVFATQMFVHIGVSMRLEQFRSQCQKIALNKFEAICISMTIVSCPQRILPTTILYTKYDQS